MKNNNKVLLVNTDSPLIDSLIPSSNYSKLKETCFYDNGAKVKKPMSDEDFLKFAEEEVLKFDTKNKMLKFFNIDLNDENTYIYELKGFILENDDIQLTQSSKYSNKYQISYIIFTNNSFSVYTFVTDLLFNYTYESCNEFAYKDVLSLSFTNKNLEYYEEDATFISKKKVKLVPIIKNVCYLEIICNGFTQKIPIFNGDSTLETISEIRKLLQYKKAN